MTRNICFALILGVTIATGALPAMAQSAQPGPAGMELPQAEPEKKLVPLDQQPSKEQLAKLFDAMRLREQMQSMRQIVPGMISQQIQGAMKQTEASLPAGVKLTGEQREAMQKVMTKYVGKAMDLYPAEEMMTDMSTIYQEHLSKDDVDGMIAFYSSPAGQHLLDAQPLIAKEYMPLVMSKVSQRSQAMTKEMMQEMAEIVPAKQPAAKPAAKPPAQ